MNPPKVGLITFGDAREHEWNALFKGLTEPRHKLAVDFFRDLPIELVAFPEVARKKDEINEQVDRLKAAGVESFIAHTPCWTSPNLVVRGVQRINLPTILISNKNAGTHGLVGFFGAGGALDQIGKDHIRILEDFDGPNVVRLTEKVLPVLRAASVVTQLKGKVFGLFGGRSLGIDTGSFDPMQWRAMFGVDAEHIDQLEIIRRADTITEDRTKAMLDWLKANVGEIAFNDAALTEDKLAYQCRCYLSTKDIIKELGLDFVAVKCMPDLTNHYIPQCLSAMLLPGPYDADGDKAPTVMACEADADAALTMEIMQLLSCGGSTMFADVSYINDESKTFYLPNCGGMCSWFAGRSSNPADNLKKVQLRPGIRPSGGAVTYLTCAPGPMTLARLYRKSGEYRMAIIPGEAIELPKKEYEAFVEARGKHQLPTAFVKVDLDVEAFIQEFGSNHICGMDGIWVKDLEYVCELLGIKSIVFD